MDRTELIREFEKIYGAGGEIVTVFSPGRVNLIGEHTDYNGGHVFPCALTIGTYYAARKREDTKVHFYSGNFPRQGVVERDIVSDLPFNPKKGFSNYPMGMVWTYAEHGMKIDRGFDVYIFGTIPNASGLSSSASIEVGMGKVLNELYGFAVPNLDIALYGQFSENRYNGVNCGIMDQFAVAMGKKDCAMFLDTATLQYEYAPVRLEGMKIVISCTNKKRGLADSKYNERRSECETALSELQKELPIQALGELTEEEFEAHKDLIKSEVRYRRARHAVYENRRTIKAVELLKAGDIEAFGKLMNESHLSTKDDYEVTGIELDTIAEESWKIDGCIGARMTGAGFGGCAVAIVKDEAVENYIHTVGEKYKAKIGYAADFYVVEIGDGTYVMS